MKKITSKPKRRQPKNEGFHEFLTPGYAMPTPIPYPIDQEDVQIEFGKSLIYLFTGLLILLLTYLLFQITRVSTEIVTPASHSIPIAGSLDPAVAAVAEQAAGASSDVYKQLQPSEATAAFQSAPNQVQTVGPSDVQSTVSAYSLQGSVGTASVHRPDGLR